MQSRTLPPRPHLDHLKNEAKALLKSLRAGDADAQRRARDTVGERSATKLADAQRILAREYGFPTWARLRAHVESMQTGRNEIDQLLARIESEGVSILTETMESDPEAAAESIHFAAVTGSAENVRTLLARDPTLINAAAGSPPRTPLELVCYSPLFGRDAEQDRALVETAKVLLDAGADPNTKDSVYGVPVLYAVTGVRSVIPIARLLLAAGANPTDGESLFHAAERFHADALELLLSAGADVNEAGEWGNTPLYFVVRWHDLARFATPRHGFDWLLAHGADPNVLCGKERETALHAAARTGQAAEIIEALVAHGARVDLRRGDGASAWRLAKRGGHEAAARALEQAGATVEPLSSLELLLGACGRGDVDQARATSSPALIAQLTSEEQMLLPNSAAHPDRAKAVEACLAAGFPVDARDHQGATALHHAAITGRRAMTRMLIAAGADLTIRDNEHRSPPLGWATFGADWIRTADGDYEGTVQALLDAGARLTEDDHYPEHAGVRRVLEVLQSGR